MPNEKLVNQFVQQFLDQKTGHFDNNIALMRTQLAPLLVDHPTDDHFKLEYLMLLYAQVHYDCKVSKDDKNSFCDTFVAILLQDFFMDSFEKFADVLKANNNDDLLLLKGLILPFLYHPSSMSEFTFAAVNPVRSSIFSIVNLNVSFAIKNLFEHIAVAYMRLKKLNHAPDGPQQNCNDMIYTTLFVERVNHGNKIEYAKTANYKQQSKTTDEEKAEIADTRQQWLIKQKRLDTKLQHCIPDNEIISHKSIDNQASKKVFVTSAKHFKLSVGVSLPVIAMVDVLAMLLIVMIFAPVSILNISISLSLPASILLGTSVLLLAATLTAVGSVMWSQLASIDFGDRFDPFSKANAAGKPAIEQNSQANTWYHRLFLWGLAKPKYMMFGSMVVISLLMAATTVTVFLMLAFVGIHATATIATLATLVPIAALGCLAAGLLGVAKVRQEQYQPSKPLSVSPVSLANHKTSATDAQASSAVGVTSVAHTQSEQAVSTATFTNAASSLRAVQTDDSNAMGAENASMPLLADNKQAPSNSLHWYHAFSPVSAKTALSDDLTERAARDFGQQITFVAPTA